MNDCPQCGQDLRLPPDALAELTRLRAVAEAADELCEAAWHDGAPDAIVRWARAREKLTKAKDALAPAEKSEKVSC